MKRLAHVTSIGSKRSMDIAATANVTVRLSNFDASKYLLQYNQDNSPVSEVNFDLQANLDTFIDITHNYLDRIIKSIKNNYDFTSIELKAFNVDDGKNTIKLNQGRGPAQANNAICFILQCVHKYNPAVDDATIDAIIENYNTGGMANIDIEDFHTYSEDDRKNIVEEEMNKNINRLNFVPTSKTNLRHDIFQEYIRQEAQSLVDDLNSVKITGSLSANITDDNGDFVETEFDIISVKIDNV